MHSIIPSNQKTATDAKKQLSLMLNKNSAEIPCWSEVESSIKTQLALKRERYFTPWETFQTFFGQVLSSDQSCRNAVIQARQRIFDQQGQLISSNTSAYCKARDRLDGDVIQSLAKSLGASLLNLVEPAWKWRGCDVALVDGTTVSMPDTASNQAKYPQHGSQKPGIGFPVARLLAVICLATGVVIDLAIGAYKTSEFTLFRNLLNSFAPGTLFICDRYFDSYFMLAGLLQKEFNGVIRVKTGTRKHHFVNGDEIVTWWRPKQKPDWMTKKQFEEFPEHMLVRIVTRKNITLVTTLLYKEKYPKRALLRLYQDRWNIEVDFRTIKCTMQMDVLRCKTSQMIQKEIWMHILAYNLVRAIMMQAAREYGLVPRQISFKATLQALHSIGILSGKAIECNMKIFLFEVITKNLVGNRRGRWEPKALKRRPKPHKFLMQPRHILKQLRLKNA